MLKGLLSVERYEYHHCYEEAVSFDELLAD